MGSDWGPGGEKIGAFPAVCFTTLFAVQAKRYPHVRCVQLAAGPLVLLPLRFGRMSPGGLAHLRARRQRGRTRSGEQRYRQ